MRHETTEIDGRKYEAIFPDGVYDPLMAIIKGPPQGIVDSLGLPEPLATRLHNELHRRGILNAKDAQTKHKELSAALQAALGIDVQKLSEEYFKYETE